MPARRPRRAWADVKHTDGTSWLQAGAMMCLWTVATATATAFKVLAHGSKSALLPLFGKLTGILVSDRATALTFWAMERRQICWAHLLRKFVSFSERAGPAATLGQRLLDLTALVFEYHHDYRDGKLPKEKYLDWMKPVREQFEATLERAVAANIDRLSGSCADVLEHKLALWTFVERDDVAPTSRVGDRRGGRLDHASPDCFSPFGRVSRSRPDECPVVVHRRLVNRFYARGK